MYYKLPGLTGYEQAWKYQKLLSEHIHKCRKTVPYHDALLLVEHPRILTLGRGATTDNLKFEWSVDSQITRKGVGLTPPDVVRIERGGEVTYHGPGQLVAYPIFDLYNHKKDLHWYTMSLEETVIELLRRNYGINAGRNDVNTGVWVEQNKIAAVGVTASRWITMHGLALNVTTNMQDFDFIVPCGITEPDTGVVNLKQVLQDSDKKGSDIKEGHMSVVADQWITQFRQVFGFNDMEAGSKADLDTLLKDYPQIAALTLPPNLKRF